MLSFLSLIWIPRIELWSSHLCSKLSAHLAVSQSPGCPVCSTCPFLHVYLCTDSLKATGKIGLDPTLMTSFYLNYLPLMAFKVFFFIVSMPKSGSYRFSIWVWGVVIATSGGTHAGFSFLFCFCFLSYLEHLATLIFLACDVFSMALILPLKGL